MIFAFHIFFLSFSLLLNQNYMWINDLHPQHSQDFIDFNSIQTRIWPFSSFITWYWEEKSSFFFIYSFYFKKQTKKNKTFNTNSNMNTLKHKINRKNSKRYSFLFEIWIDFIFHFIVSVVESKSKWTTNPFLMKFESNFITLQH